MDVLRTPDERFAGLPDWPYEPRYTEVPDGDGGTLRVHHAEDGPADGPTVLLLHGEPTWGYLYRTMMPALAEEGVRSIVPDQVGFGRSDKPASRNDYSYQRHVDWMQAWLDVNGTDGLFFFGQDWGGLVGLRLVAADPDRFAGLVVSNTGLPDGSGIPNEAFMAWQRFSQTTEEFPVGQIISGGCISSLPSQVIDAYDAPFPDDTFKEGARIWPSLVPTSADDPAASANRAAWEVLSGYTRPVVCAFSDQDPVSRGGERAFLSRVPGAAHQPHTTVDGAGHFVQEDQPEKLVQVLVNLVGQVG